MDKKNIYRLGNNNFTISLMEIIAWIAIVLEIIAILIGPAMLGKDRGKFTYANWIGSIIGAVMVILLSLRVLGKI